MDPKQREELFRQVITNGLLVDQLARERQFLGQLTNSAEKTIKLAWKAYAVAAGLILTVLLLVGGVAGWFGLKTLKDLKEEARAAAQREIEVSRTLIRSNLQSEITQVNVQVHSELERQFAAPTISNLIYETASNEVAKTAAPTIGNLMRSNVIPLLHTTTNELLALRSEITNSRRDLSTTVTNVNVLLTILKSQADDSHAYDQLRAWQKDTTFPFRSEVNKAIEEATLAAVLRQPLPEEILTNCSLQQLVVVLPYWEAASREAFLIKVASGMPHLGKNYKVHCLMQLLRTEPSLRVRTTIGRILTELTGHNGIHVLAADEWLSWWATNIVHYPSESPPKPTYEIRGSIGTRQYSPLLLNPLDVITNLVNPAPFPEDAAKGR